MTSVAIHTIGAQILCDGTWQGDNLLGGRADCVLVNPPFTGATGAVSSRNVASAGLPAVPTGVGELKSAG